MSNKRESRLQPPAAVEVWMFMGTDGAWHTFLNEQHRLDTIADGRWEVRKFIALPQQQEQDGEVEGLLDDLETIWHSISDDKETNAAYERLKAALARRLAPPSNARGEWVLAPREVLDEARNIAMEWTLKGRVPECGKFGQIAQDLDAILAAPQPPSALMGVEDGPIDASDNAEYIEHCADRLERCGLPVTAGALRAIAHVHRTLAQQSAAVHEPCAAVAAIQFALTDPEGMTFLRLWNEGEFDILRREWPDAPSEVYVGADPLAQQPTACPRSTHHVHRATESLPCYCHAKDDHPIGSEQLVEVKTLSEFMDEQEALHPGIQDKVQAAADELRASLAQQPAAKPDAEAGLVEKAYAGCTIWRGSLRVSVTETEAIEHRIDADEAFCNLAQRALDSLAAAWDDAALAQQPAQQDGGGCSHEAWEENGGWCECVDCGHGWSARTAPPAAQATEVDAPGSRAWMAEVCRAAALSLAAHGVCNDQLSKVADWIAQQPAAVDEGDARDAERYRWLRKALLGAEDDPIDHLLLEKEPETEVEFDAAVDAAIATQHQEPKS